MNIDTKEAGMRLSICRGRTGLAKLSAALSLSLFSPSIAEARDLTLPLDVQLSQAIVMLLSSTSSCVTFSYDLNGNRTSQNVSTVGAATTTWGSSPFGCFLWTS